MFLLCNFVWLIMHPKRIKTRTAGVLSVKLGKGLLLFLPLAIISLLDLSILQAARIFSVKNKIPSDPTLLLEEKIKQQRKLVQAWDGQINFLQDHFKSSQDAQIKKSILKQIDLNKSKRAEDNDKLQSYLLLLTKAHQVPFLSNLRRADEIKDLLKFQKMIEDSNITFSSLQKKYSKDDLLFSTKHYLPPLDCSIERSKDGQIHANAFSALFSFTPDDLKKYYPESDFLNTYVRFLHSGKKYYLEFKFEFQSVKASQYFGIIEETSPIKIQFLDDDYVILQNSITAKPDVLKNSGKTIYKMQCSVGKSELAKLKKKDLNKLVIVWPNGAETYELFNLHVFQNLIECLQVKS